MRSHEHYSLPAVETVESLLMIRDVASRLAVHPNIVRRLACGAELPHVLVGPSRRLVLYRERDVAALVRVAGGIQAKRSYGELRGRRRQGGARRACLCQRRRRPEDVVAARCRCVMSESRQESIAELEEQLEGVSRTLSAMDELNARQAARVAARMDRLASQLLEISPPPAMEAVYQRLGVTPASDEEFASLVDEMGAPDGEG